MTPLDSRIDEDFVGRFYRGEPIVLEGLLEDKNGAPEELDDRTFWACIMAADGTTLHEVLAEVVTEGERQVYRGAFDGTVTDDCFGRPGLIWSQGEYVVMGDKTARRIHAQGPLIIYTGPGSHAPAGTNGISAIAHRIVRREAASGRSTIRISQNGARGRRGPGPWDVEGESFETWKAANITGPVAGALQETDGAIAAALQAGNEAIASAERADISRLANEAARAELLAANPLTLEAREQAAAFAASAAAAKLGMGERLRDVQPTASAQSGAALITSANAPSGISIASGQTGANSFIRPSLPIPLEIAARFAGTTIRLKAAFAASPNFLDEKPLATSATQLGLATLSDGTSVSTGFTQQVLSQSSGYIYREVSYTLGGTETQLALLAQITSASTANSHSLELRSLSFTVDAVPAGAGYTGADVMAAWRSYEQRIGVGPIFTDALGLGVAQNNGGTYLNVGARTLGISIAAGSTGQNAAAGLVVPIDATVAPLLAGKTGRVRLALLTSTTFTRALTGTMRARYAIQFQGTISGNVLTITSPAVNAVTGAPIAIPAGTQGVITAGLGGSPAFYMSGLASGTSGAVGSTYTLQNAQTGYALPTTFTIFAYRFFSCVVESDLKLSPTRRQLTIAAFPNQPFAGDELFIEPYVSIAAGAATSSVETWQIEDASLSLVNVALGTVAGPAEVAQNVAHLRATASARALAAADAQANYSFGIGDVLPACAIADQVNTGTGGTTLAGNTATIPAGLSGRNMIFQRIWPFDGAGNVGKRVRLKLGFVTSETFTRALTCAFQVRTSAGTVARSATITPQTSGRSITYQIDYTAQGDEIALAPYVICSSTGATSAVETWTYASMLAYFMSSSSPGRSVADENIAQLSSSILAQAAALVATNGTYAGVKTVKPAGGDFTHPKLALDAITDASAAKRYAVLIYPGTYDGYAEWHTKDYVDLIGVGRREEVIIQYALPNDAPAATITNTSTFWWDTASNLINLTVTARNMRYAVHQETNGQRVGITQIAENCAFIHYGNDAAVNNTWQVGSQAAMGTGSSDGMTAIHRWCRFVGPGVTGYHGPNAGPARARPIKFRWEGCEMVVTRNGVVVTNQPAMVANPLQQGPGDTFEIIGNTIGGEVHYISGWLNAADTTTNRAQIEIVGYGNTPFTFVNKINGAPGGDYVPRLTGR